MKTTAIENEENKTENERKKESKKEKKNTFADIFMRRLVLIYPIGEKIVHVNMQNRNRIVNTDAIHSEKSSTIKL